MRFGAAALALILLFPAPARAQDGVRIAPAYQRGDEVCFEPFVPVAWDVLARGRFQAFDPDRPPPEAVRQRWNEIFRRAYFDYEAPVPTELRGYHYVLAEQGVRALRLTRLRGEIAYESDADARQVGAPRFSGEACGVSAAGPAQRAAGFVLFAPAQLSPRVRTLGAAGGDPAIVTRAAGGAVVYTYRAGTRAEDFATRPAAEPQLRSAYVLELPGGRRWLVVRWQPDPQCRAGCCEFAYSLYALDPALTPLLENRYACDV